MADYVTITPGSGENIASDEIAGLKHQRVKLQYGEDGSATDVSDTNPLPIDDAGGSITVDGTVTANLSATDNAVLDAIQTAVELIDNAISGTEMQVDVVAALPAGTNNIGDVDVASIAAGETHIGAVGASDTVVTITASLDTSAYTAGDVLFDTQEIANAARTSGGVVVLQSVTVQDKDKQSAEMDLVFLDANTSLGTENAAIAMADAAGEDVLGTVTIGADLYKDLGGYTLATSPGIGLEMKADASTSLYVGAVTRGTPTHTASGLVIKFAFLRS